jgi:hypothetical protein
MLSEPLLHIVTFLLLNVNWTITFKWGTNMSHVNTVYTDGFCYKSNILIYIHRHF